MRPALTNCLHRAYFGRNLRAKVVFPEPLGPAAMYNDGRLPSFFCVIRQPYHLLLFVLHLLLVDSRCASFSLFC